MKTPPEANKIKIEFLLKTIMKPLPKEYRKNTFYFKEVYREDMIAIYSQHLKPGLPPRWYEVFVIKITDFKRNVGDFREVTPPSSEWGKFGFTFWNIDQAYQKCNILLKTLRGGLPPKHYLNNNHNL